MMGGKQGSQHHKAFSPLTEACSRSHGVAVNNTWVYALANRNDRLLYTIML